MKNILIIDDEPMILSLLKQALTRAGFGTIQAKSASEGWNIIQKTPVDLVITDIHMPDFNGLDLAAGIRRCASLPLAIIGMSGTPLDRGPHPFDAFFIKPFSVAALVHKIHDLMTLHQSLLPPGMVTAGHPDCVAPPLMFS